MPGESKKHHFVPRSLLKNFYNKDRKLFVFDKALMKTFPATADNTAHENYFNSIEIAGERYNFEEFYSDIDSQQAKLLTKITSFTETWNLTETEIWLLAYFTLVQMHRTKLSRTTIVEFSHEIHDWMASLNKNGPYAPLVDTRVDPEQSKLITLEQINRIPEQIHHLTDRVMNIVKAPEHYPFYCSDNPIVLYNPYSYLRTGLGGVGTEVCFPISKNLLVNFTCSVTAQKTLTVYRDYSKRGLPIPEPIERLYRGLYLRQIIELDPQYVDFYNHLQVSSSSRFIYGSKDDFGVAKKMLEHNPSLKEVKTKMGLGSHPMTDMPDGDHIALTFTNKEHTLISVELLEGEIDLRFRVCKEDAWKVAMLYETKEPIEFAQTFKDKMESRGMRDVVIISFDPSTRIGVISHRDEGFNQILKFVMEERAKRKKQ